MHGRPFPSWGSHNNYKDIKTKKNQEQGFVSGKKLRNMWCESCLEVQKQKNNKVGSRIKYTKYGRKDIIVEKKISKEEIRNIWCLEYRTGKKQLWWNQRVVAYLEQEKLQQSSTQTEALKSTTRKRSEQREMRRIFKMLREM